jgi:mRNA interferase MazF
MNVQRGDVVMVDWIYSDRTGSKRRPALVIQADVYNTVLDDTILALITSSTRRRVGAATQLEIDISMPDGQQTGLSIDSVVQCENRWWPAARHAPRSQALPGNALLVRVCLALPRSGMRGRASPVARSQAEPGNEGGRSKRAAQGATTRKSGDHRPAVDLPHPREIVGGAHAEG